MAVIFSSALAGVAVTVATCLVAAYLYVTRAFTYWKTRGVHYIEPTSILGNLGPVALQRQHIGEFLKEVYDGNPGQPVVGLFAGVRPLLMARREDVVRGVMVKDAHAFLDRALEPSPDADPLLSRSLFVMKGRKWRHMRIKLTPTFTSGKIKNMFHLIDECGQRLLPCLEQEMSKGDGVLVKDTVAMYSTDVIASCAFGVDANALADPSSEFHAVTKMTLNRTAFQQVILMLLFSMPRLVKLLKLKAIKENINNFYRKTFWDVVDFRKKNRVVRKDFVDILMHMKDKGEVQAEDAKDLEEIQQDSKYVNLKTATTDKFDMILDDDDFVAQAFIFIAAGFETSSSVISFTLYELALNPDIQDKLRREILAVLDKHNSQVTYDTIIEMTYLEMVVAEALRKYPTLPFLHRKCLQDYQLPGTEITVQKGTIIMIPVLAIHYDPVIHPDPHKFDPERFSNENKSKRSHLSHLPFGEGPRICIGMRFGLMQVKTALVHILTSFSVKPCGKTPRAPLKMKANTGINVPKEDIILAFEKIK